MAIHFNCSQCGAPFVVEERLSGRTAHCKRCGSRTTIPGHREAALAAAPAGPAVAALAAGGGKAAVAAPPAPPKPAAQVVPAARPLNWIDAVTSQVALAPITEQRLSALRKKPTPLDDASFTGLYKVMSAPSLPALESARGRSAGAITRTYRHEMFKIQSLFRWLNQSAYLVSVPFLMILLLGVITNNQSILALGATVVVALNIGRLVAGLANLLVIPFRDSPIQGVLFLIPPITFIYLYQNWNKVRKPLQRIIGPIGTIGLVILAFVVAPMLHSGLKKNQSIKDQVTEGVGSAKETIGKKLDKASGLNVDDLSKLLPEARKALESFKKQGAEQ